jgi:uncharacterized protein YkwD
VDKIQMNFEKLGLQHRSAHGYFCVFMVVFFLCLHPCGVAARETYTQFATRITAHPPEGAEVRPDLEALILRATNAYRAQKKYPALKPITGNVRIAARAHAIDLLATAGMGHVASTGHNFESRIRAFNAGQMVLTPMAENAARLRKSDLSDTEMAQALVQQWVKSPGHRKNLISRDYVDIAIGVVKRGDDVYAVQIFSGPKVKSNMFGGVQP